MQRHVSLALAGGLLFLLGGCAGQTTDPRQGGLFSYNPEAYEQRLQDRRENLSQVDQANQREEAESAALVSERAAQQKENAALKRQVKKLSASISKLEKELKAVDATTMAQKQQKHRILAELRSLQSASRKSDFIEDPEAKQQELKRLQQRRDQLEKEAAGLMQL